VYSRISLTIAVEIVEVRELPGWRSGSVSVVIADPFSPFPGVVERREEGKTANRRKRRMPPERDVAQSGTTEYDRAQRPLRNRLPGQIELVASLAGRRGAAARNW
jgi:hypothetical protein